MADVLAYFITWTTYGTWLPGDRRGWKQRGKPGVQPPDLEREERARRLMTDDEVVLTSEQRRVVEAAIEEHCAHRGWMLHARNARSNHVHAVVTAPVDGDTVRERLKLWASRRLSEHAGITGGGKDGKRRWWTERGDVEEVETEPELADVVEYVMERQGPRQPDA